MHDDTLTTVLQHLATFCAERARPAWLVGGTVRDMVLGRVPLDIDIAVDGDGVALARAFADRTASAFVPLDDARGTGRVIWDYQPVDAGDAAPQRIIIDLVQLRAPTLEEDLRLRDFTINALALPLADPGSVRALLSVPPSVRSSSIAQMRSQIGLIDPCRGLDDIATRTLRPCTPDSLRNDPVRMLRAVRLAAEHKLSITPELDVLMRQANALIARVAAERVRDELLKLLNLPSATPWLRALDDMGILTRIFPELEQSRACEQPVVHFLPVLAHSLETVASIEWLLAGLDDQQPAQQSHWPVAVQVYPTLPRTLPYAPQFRTHFAQEFGSGESRRAIIKLATLLHDNAKPQTKQERPDGTVTFYDHQKIGAYSAQHSAHRLRLTRQAASYIRGVIDAHMRPGQLRSSEKVTPRAIARFFRDTGDAGPDVLLHGLADHMAARGPQIDPHDWYHHLAWVGVLLDTYWGKPAVTQRRVPLVNGNDLMQVFSLDPGKLIGDLLREIGDAQIAGEITTRDEALDLARELVGAHQQGEAG